MTGSLTKNISEKALDLGFDLVGYAPARPLEEEREPLEEYLEKGWHGCMEWLRRPKEKMLRPDLILKDARSVISLGINYFNDKWEHPSQGFYGSFSRYTYGKDYHSTIGSKVAELIRFLRKEAQCKVQYFVDDGPILEKKWATQAGIGWRGKNSLIYTEAYGSWIFLAELIANIELEYDGADEEDRCGDCTMCMDSCPTGAIESPYRLNASRCISYHNIEIKEAVPESVRSLLGNTLYGCDICQEVCPLNNVAQPTQEDLFLPQNHILDLSLHDLRDLSEARFQKLFKESAVVRGGRKRLLGNIALILGNTHSEDAIQPLAGLFKEEEQIVRIHTAWALGQIPGRQAKNTLEDFLKKEHSKAVQEEIKKALDSPI